MYLLQEQNLLMRIIHGIVYDKTVLESLCLALGNLKHVMLLSSLIGMFRYGKIYYYVDRTLHALCLVKNPCLLFTKLTLYHKANKEA